MELGELDIADLYACLPVITVIGFYIAHTTTNSEKPFVGRRAFPGRGIGLNPLETSITSITGVACSAEMFKTAWPPFIRSPALPVGNFIAAHRFLRIFCKRLLIPACEVLEQRFGRIVDDPSRYGCGELERIRSAASLVSWTILSEQAMVPERFSVPSDLYYTGLIGNFNLFCGCPRDPAAFC